MYRFSYDEIFEESGAVTRERERMALDHAIELLTVAADAGPNSREATAALEYLQRLWAFLIRDLANPNNELAEALRANLISIGLWMLKEADQIVQDRSQNFAGLIDINRTIRDGLR
ncbi:flagellar biosynthesis regulator FlaF [Xanthobacter sp. VNH20]|uniref:flagellar biosynthesis regulator FlaF n=1 Tax=Xanthobacter sp. VNH20 TaxID=3156616 RepID=UPI0032B60DBC